METDSAGKYGHDFRIGRHFRRKEDHRYEYEHRTEHIHEVWDEVQIVVEYDGSERRFLLNKVVNLLTDVEDDDDADDQKQRHEERAYEFADNV